MTIFTYLEAHPERTPAILGLESDKYRELVEDLSRAEQQWNQREPNKVYLRQPGGGAKVKLSLGQEVGLCLLVFKQAVNFEIAGLLVGLSSTQAHDIFWKWLPRMRDSIPTSLVEEWEALGEEGPWEADEKDRIVDSWEQARETQQQSGAKEVLLWQAENAHPKESNDQR